MSRHSRNVRGVSHFTFEARTILGPVVRDLHHRAVTMTHCMREDRGTVDVPDRHGPPIEQLERRQLPRPLAPADPARVVLRPAPPRLVVVDVLVIGLVPILVAPM